MTFSIINLLLYVLFIFLVGILGMVVSFLLYLHYIHKLNEHLPGPPRTSFVFGNLKEIAEYMKTKTLMLYHLEKRLEYGPIYVIFILHRPVVVLGDPYFVKQVIIDNHNYACKSKCAYERIGFVFGQRFLGVSLVTNADNMSWRRRRQLMNPAFHRKCLRDYMADFNEVCDRFLARMTSIVEGKQQISMVKEFGRVIQDVTSQVLFNVKIGAIEDPNSRFATAIASALEGVEANIVHPFTPTLLSLFQFRLFQNAKQKEQIDAVKFLRKFAFDCVTKRINDIKADKETTNDLLTLLVNDQSLSMDDIIDEFITIFFAGHGATSNSLSFALYEIAQSPDIEENILNEVNSVLGGNGNVDFQDLAKLKYLGQVLQESLRKYPVVDGPVRVLQNEITVGGYAIPKGNIVHFSKYSFSHNPEIWENPDVFDPDRFEEPDKIPNFSRVYFPFSIGPRSCIGQAFAKFASKIILARLLRKFRFQLLPGQTAAMQSQFSPTPRDGVVCNVMLRGELTKK